MKIYQTNFQRACNSQAIETTGCGLRGGYSEEWYKWEELDGLREQEFGRLDEYGLSDILRDVREADEY